MNRYNACYILAISGLLFGFDTAVISGTLGMVVKQFSLDEVQEGNYVGFGLYGCLLGVFVSGFLADKAGRKASSIVSALLYTVSAIGCTYATSFTSLCFYRLTGGVAVGVTSTLTPLFISEIAPANKRGSLVSVYQLLLTGGILLAYISNSTVLKFFSVRNPHTLFEQEVWRPMYFMMAVPSIIYFVLLFMIPESPRWLQLKGMRQKALEIGQKFGIEVSDVPVNKVSMLVFLKGGNLRKLLTGMAIPFLGQFTGINAIIYYGPKILASVGFGAKNALMVQVLFGVVNFLVTFVAIRQVDKSGRKPLLLYGLSGIIISLVALSLLAKTALYSLLIFFVISFIVCYAFSLGPVQWVVISELFPAAIRGRAVSICTFSLWIAAAAIGNLFPVILGATSISFCFMLFGIASIALLIIIYTVLAENKGKSLDDIERDWEG